VGVKKIWRRNVTGCVHKCSSRNVIFGFRFSRTHGQLVLYLRLRKLTHCSSCDRSIISSLMGTLKPQCNPPLYSNTVIGTLAVGGCAVAFGTAPPSTLLAVPNVTAHQSTVSVPTSYYSIWHYKYLCTLIYSFSVVFGAYDC